MKKIFMIMMLFLTTVVGYGKNVSNVDSENTSDYVVKEQTLEMYDFSNFNVNESKNSVNVLGLSDNQKEKVVSIMNDFNEEMIKSYNDKNRKKKVIKTINKNVEEMATTLWYNQYKKYLRILNLELNRRGIDLF